MKFIAVVSTINLKYRLGCTPAWWQLLKSLHEIGNEVVIVPYLGGPCETLWWRAYPNPWRMPGELYYALSRKAFPKREGRDHRLRERMAFAITRAATLPVWRKHLRNIMTAERGVDVLMFFNVPLNQIAGIPTEMKRLFGVTTAFYDGDMPTILPGFVAERGFMFDYYQNAHLDEYDFYFVNSEGIVGDLQKRGARNVKPLHYAADPQLFQPVDAEKKWDLAFFGYGDQRRKKWITRMITEPSRTMTKRFVVGGTGFSVDLGEAEQCGDVPMSQFRHFCCSSKINLNITRDTHTDVYASSTARPFELAAMACCVVSCPYNGLEKWFSPPREIVIVSEEDDLVETYEMLISDSDTRERMGAAARKRVLRDHTYEARARELVCYLKGR